MLDTFSYSYQPFLLLQKSVCSVHFPFIGWLAVILRFNFLSSLCILEIDPLPDEYLAKVFSHSVGCLFTLLILFFAATV
jgi:hypothetical protein